MAKVLKFQLQHQSFHEYSGLISFRMDWLDLPAVQRTLKSLLQYHSSKASIPLQYSGLENSMYCIVHGVAKSRIQLSDFPFTFHFHALEKAMATHSSILAWRIPGTGEPGGLLSLGSHRVWHDWSDLAVAAAYMYVSQILLYSFLRSTISGIYSVLW